MNNIQDIFLNAINTVFSQIASFLPSVLWALTVFVIGVIVSNWAKGITVAFVKTIRLEKLLHSTGIEKILKKAHLPFGLERLLGQIVRWIILLIFFISAMNILGLYAVSDILNRILGYVPNVLSAVLILAIGILVAGLLEVIVKGAVSSFNPKASRLLGKVTSYTIMVFVVLAAISELKIAQDFIQTIFMGVVATLSIGVGLALGLGSKTTVEKIVGSWYEQAKK